MARSCRIAARRRRSRIWSAGRSTSCAWRRAAATLPLARSGKVRAYAIMSPTRLPAAQEIPTADEAGLPGFHLSFWQAFWVPKGTPKDVVDEAQRRGGGGARRSGVRAKLTELGVRSFRRASSRRRRRSPRCVKAEAEKWWPIIKAAGIKPDHSAAGEFETVTSMRSNDETSVGRLALIARRRQRRRADLSEQVDDHHRAVRGRRAVRRAGAHHGRPHEGDARPVFVVENVTGAAGSIGVGRAVTCGARRLHHQLRASRHACRQRRDLSAALRHADRSRAGGAAAEQSDGGGEHQQAAGEEPEGADRLAEGQPDKATAGTAGAGSGSHIAGVYLRPDRAQAAIRALSRHRAGAERSGRRPDRHHRRSGVELHAADPRRQHPRLCDHRREAARGGARHSDRRGGRPAGLPHDAVERAVGAEGHAEGRRSRG